MSRLETVCRRAGLLVLLYEIKKCQCLMIHKQSSVAIVPSTILHLPTTSTTYARLTARPRGSLSQSGTPPPPALPGPREAQPRALATALCGRPQLRLHTSARKKNQNDARPHSLEVLQAVFQSRTRRSIGLGPRPSGLSRVSKGLAVV